MPGITAFGSTVELRLNASSNCAAKEGAIVSEQSRGLHASETRLVARTIALNARHKRASGILSRYAKARHLLCGLSWRGRVLANARTRGMLCQCVSGFNLTGKSYAPVAKSTMADAP